MKTRMTTLTLLVVGVLSLTLAGRAASQKSGKLTPAVVPISDPCPGCFHPGLFGITRGQTMRINAANLQPARDPDQPPPELERVQLSFFDTQGNLLARSEQTLLRGHAVFFDLNGAGLSSAFEPNRVQIVGEVKLIPPPDGDRTTPPPSGDRVPIVTSVEVFDNTGIDAGKTRLYEDITRPAPRASS